MLLFFMGINYEGLQDGISRMFFPQDNDLSKFEKVNIYQFAGRINTCWNQCRFGEFDANCGTVLLTSEFIDNNKLDSNLFRSVFDKLNYCSDCNLEVSSTLGSEYAPMVVKLRCIKGNPGRPFFTRFSRKRLSPRTRMPRSSGVRSTLPSAWVARLIAGSV